MKITLKNNINFSHYFFSIDSKEVKNDYFVSDLLVKTELKKRESILLQSVILPILYPVLPISK